MSIISNHHNKITLIYNSNTRIGKQTLAYVTNSRKKLLAINTSKTNLTGTQWLEIIDALGISINQFINTSHPNFVKLYHKDVNMELNDWLKIIEKHPEVIVTPIFINGTTYKQISSSSEIERFLAPDSAGISRNP